MKANIEHKGKSGIYCIRNIINNKCYVGKAKCIHKRIKTHITNLNRKIKHQENAYIINAWHKYGTENFEYSVLEFLELDDVLLKTQELYWIIKFDCINRKKGYNLRLDSSTRMIINSETSKKLSIATKKRFESQDIRDKLSKQLKDFWKNNPEIKKTMAENVSKAKQKYNFEQYDLNNNLIRVWYSIKEIISENPTYKWQQIYSVCNGYKPTIYKYIWRKELKI